MPGMQTILIGDLGGTNARFAVVDTRTGGFDQSQTLQCADFCSAEAAIRYYLKAQDLPAPDAICLAAAGPCINGDIDLTNNDWALSTSDLQAKFAVSAVRLINDFEAIAYAIPYLKSEHCLPIASGKPHSLTADFTVAIIGPGTGLGVAALQRRGDVLLPVVGEGGHAAFAPRTALQIELLQALTRRFGNVSIERLVSGPGIENIYTVLADRSGKAARNLSAPEIFQRAANGNEPLASEAAALFFEILGQVAADLTLIFGAVDGLYIAGGITRRYEHLLQASSFREAFDNVGKHCALMRQIPTYMITQNEPGLLGAAQCALQTWRSLSFGDDGCVKANARFVPR